jgi:acetoin utilization deacetylase AcuC-like enzyme
VGLCAGARRGAGLGADLNIPLSKGTNDDGYLQALEVSIRPFRRSRPERWSSPSASARQSMIRSRGWPSLPTASAASVRSSRGWDFRPCRVQEGGYLSDILGANLTAVLAGFEEAR